MKTANRERVKRVDELIKLYSQIMSEYEDSPYSDEPGEDKLSDLFADIRHWADKNKVDIFKALERSYNYYLEEK